MDRQRKLMGLVLIGGLATLVSLSFWPDHEQSSTTQVYAQQTAESLAAQQQSIAGAEQLSSAFRGAAKAVWPSVVRINAMVKTRVMRRGCRGSQPQLPPGFPFFCDEDLFRNFQERSEDGR